MPAHYHVLGIANTFGHLELSECNFACWRDSNLYGPQVELW